MGWVQEGVNYSVLQGDMVRVQLVGGSRHSSCGGMFVGLEQVPGLLFMGC